MPDHEVIDEVLLNKLGDRQSMTLYTHPPLPQTPTSSHRPCDVLTGLPVLDTMPLVFLYVAVYCREADGKCGKERRG